MLDSFFRDARYQQYGFSVDFRRELTQDFH